MGRHKKAVPEVPVIDYKKQIAAKYAETLIDEVRLNNLSQFIVHANSIINKNELELEEIDREFAHRQCILLNQIVITPRVTDVDKKEQIDWIAEMILEMFGAIKFDDYNESVSDIQRYFAHDLNNREYSVGDMNDMHAGLTALGLILEAFTKMNKLITHVNPNGKLIEVPE